MPKQHYFLLLCLFFILNTILKAQKADTTLAHQAIKQAKKLQRDRKLKESLVQAEKAAIIFEKHALWDNWVVAQRLRYRSYGIMGDFQKAWEVTENALELTQGKMGEESLGKHQLYLDKTNLLYYMGRYNEAVALGEDRLLRLIQLFGQDHEIVGTAYEILGNIYQVLGSFDKALDFKLKKLQITQRRYGEIHALTAAAQENIGNSYLQLKDYEGALSFHQKALEIRLKVFKDEWHPRMLNSYNNLGICYGELGQYKLSETYFLKAFEINKKRYGEVHPAIADYLWNLGNFYSKISDYDKALKAFEKELSLRKQLGSHRADFASNYQRIGNLYRNSDQPSKALIALNKALSFISEDFDDQDNLYLNPNLEQVKLHSVGLRYVFDKLIALYYFVEKHPTDQKAIQSGLQLGNLCLELWEGLRHELGRQKKAKHNNSEVVRVAMQYASMIAFQGYHLTKEAHFARKAYQFEERSKALLLKETLLQVNTQGLLPENLAARERQLSDQLAQYESQFFTAWAQEDSVQIAHLRDDLLFKTKVDYDKLILEIEQNYPKYYDLKYRTSTLDASEIQHLLQEDELFIEYLVQKRTRQLLIFVQEKNKPLQLYRVSMPKNLEEKVTRFYKLLKSYQLNRRDKKSRFVGLSFELYKILIQPIETHLKDKNKINIVGEAFTNYIPFEALVTSGEIKPFTELNFLIKKYEVVYQYAATLWARARQKNSNYDGDLLAFAPVFENTKTAGQGTRGPASSLDTVLRSVDQNGNFTILKYSKEEVDKIAKLFDQQQNKGIQVLLKEQASEQNLKKALEGNFRFVHLASHSFSDLKRPELSGIACISNADTEKENGILFSGEIYNMKINSDLIVLSSCESGVGKIVQGEGMLGLNRSFVYAGVPNVIFSLWKVYDRIGSEMMLYFYQAILDGQSYATALRSTKLKLLAKEETASPEFWSAFLLIGE